MGFDLDAGDKYLYAFMVCAVLALCFLILSFTTLAREARKMKVMSLAADTEIRNGIINGPAYTAFKNNTPIPHPRRAIEE